MKVDGNDGDGGTFAAAAGCVEELPLSSFESNCFNLLKYRSEANSVRWRGSMISCVWPSGHPVAVLGRCVIDKAYQDSRGTTLFTGGSPAPREMRRKELRCRRKCDAHASWYSRV